MRKMRKIINQLWRLKTGLRTEVNNLRKAVIENRVRNYGDITDLQIETDRLWIEVNSLMKKVEDLYNEIETDRLWLK